jgi:hypothetical protein
MYYCRIRNDKWEIYAKTWLYPISQMREHRKEKLKLTVSDPAGLRNRVQLDMDWIRYYELYPCLG